jgi:hypothetical protein
MAIFAFANIVFPRFVLYIHYEIGSQTPSSTGGGLKRSTFLLSLVLVFVVFASVNAQEVIGAIADSSDTLHRPSPAKGTDSLKAAPASSTLSEEPARQVPSAAPSKRFGFGISFGERIYYPPEINDFSKDIFNELKNGYVVTSELGSADIFMAYAFRAHFLFLPVPNLGVTPYGDILWSPKFLMTNYSSENINLLCYTGGVNAVGIFTPHKRVSFKAGAGLSYGSANLYASGDLGSSTISGSVFGINLLAGINITFSKVMINVDFTVPVQAAQFTSQSGYFLGPSYDVVDGGGPTYRYPKSANLIGLEINEGVTFLW